MYFGVDYYPEQWVFPYAGTAENPESEWEKDADLMAEASINVVRFGELTWGLCEREEGKYDFKWLERAMDVMGKRGIKVILGTPTAAPPLWLSKKHPEILPIDEYGRVRHEGTRRAVCLNSDVYWNSSKRIVEQMAAALGKHPQLIAWQIDNSLGGHFTEEAFNEDTRRDWHGWLMAKYETIDRLNDLMGLRHWGQVVTDWSQVPMPMHAPTRHNPALMLDWRRFCSDTIVQFARMQADVLRQYTPQIPVTTNLRPLLHRFDHFDLAEVLDFVSIESQAGNASWQEVNSLVRPGVLRMFTYQLLSRGANAIMYFRWRQPRIGTEQFHGAVLTHSGAKTGRVYKEVSQIGEEMKLLAPGIKDTKLKAEVCILYSHENDWALQLPNQPNKHFKLREHIHLIYSALHGRNIVVDFARPSEDLSKYKLVFAPSLSVLSAGDADRLKLYVQSGGTLVSTFNTGLVDEHHMAPNTGYPHNLTDLFGLEVLEFDALPPGEENPMIFKGTFPTSHMNSARIWCDIIEPKTCQVLATYAKDFYSGRPAMTINDFGLGKAIYIGTMGHQTFYNDLVIWLRQLCNLNTLLKVPEHVEVAMRESADAKVFFLLNHLHSPVRVQFYKPMHEFLTATNFSGGHDIPPYGVLVLDEHPELKA